MIVKNEAGVIRRCLDSVRPLIDCWVIVDTGSTDGTQQLIRDHLTNVPGELHERPWKNFGHNRSEALALARGKADYMLVIDADEHVVIEQGFELPSGADVYLVPCNFENSPVSWHRATFAKGSLPWRYEGVLHEYLECGQPPDRRKLDGIRVISHTDGARNKDPVAKYRNDAALLEQGVRDEPNNARYVFYLAQSYRDAQEPTKALEAYERRVAMGGWAEEVYFSLLQIAVLKQRLKHPPEGVVAAFLRAYAFRPTRAEALVELATYYRHTAQWPLAELFARAALGVPPSNDILFVDTAAYGWRPIDELAIAAYYVEKYEEAATLNRRLLAGDLPASQRPRIQENLDFALKRLGRAASPAATG
jgi:tetratricopeptide (TPR) repeat protein